MHSYRNEYMNLLWNFWEDKYERPDEAFVISKPQEKLYTSKNFDYSDLSASCPYVGVGKLGNYAGKYESFVPQKRAKFENWKPCSKLGRLVKSGKFDTLEQLFCVTTFISEPEIVDYLAGDFVKVEVIKTIPVHKPKKFKAVVAVGCPGFLGIASCYKKKLQDAITGATLSAKLSVRKIRISANMKGRCGSVRVQLEISGKSQVVKNQMSKLLLNLCGVENYYVISNIRGDLANQAFAIFEALTAAGKQ